MNKLQIIVLINTLKHINATKMLVERQIWSSTLNSLLQVMSDKMWYVKYRTTGEQRNSLVCLKTLDLQDDSLLMQSCCGVLQRLGFPLFTALTVPFAVQFYWSAWIPGHTKQSHNMLNHKEPLKWQEVRTLHTNERNHFVHLFILTRTEATTHFLFRLSRHVLM